MSKTKEQMFEDMHECELCGGLFYHHEMKPTPVANGNEDCDVKCLCWECADEVDCILKRGAYLDR